MARVFRLPDIGEGLTEAEVVSWLVGVGDPVGIDQPVVEMETDKAVTDIPSPFAGVLLYQGGEEGSTIKVGDVLIVVGYEGEEWTRAGRHDGGAEAAPIVGTLSEEAVLLGGDESATGEQIDRPKALPLVRKLAKEHGLLLEDLRGTGPQGRITRDDVLAALDVPADDVADAPVVAESEVGAESAERQIDGDGVDDEIGEPGSDNGSDPIDFEVAAPSEDVERVPMTRLRRTIAARMSRSWAEIPHVTTFETVDASRLLQARRALARRTDIGIPMEALIVRAVVPALRSFPEFNASIDGDDLLLRRSYDIGVAVDTDDGLIVTVLHDAGAAAVTELAVRIVELAAGARARSLEPSELSGATFTVSNIGAVGGGFGTPIVPFGTTAILSVGRATDQAVVHDGKIEVAPMMPLSLSYDHRVIDGGVGRRFMALVAENLEEPALFLAD